jgi:hypothetical protein
MNKDRKPVKVFIPKNARRYSEGFEVIIYESIYQVPFKEYTDKSIFILETMQVWVEDENITLQRWWKKLKGGNRPYGMIRISKLPKSLKIYSILV